MNDKKLYTNLSKLGFPMLEPSDELDVDETLAEVIKSHDTRLWEGFPVMLATAAENYKFKPEEVKQQFTRQKEKDRFHRLTLLSGALFTLYHLSFSWWSKLRKGLSKDDKALFKKWRDSLVHNQTIKCNGAELDPERLKRLFELYFERKTEKDRLRKVKYEEFSLEYALSQVFSPKQKELFKKKLEGLPLTKSEREYYSRTVKKKVLALANSDLHSLSKRLLGL